MPTISVIVPVYNVEKYLNRCIDSILAQTFTDFELILVNDGSTDSSGKICDEYAKKDDRIVVIHQDNQGQAAARNNAIKISSGEWIHFVDGDDLIHPQMLEILYNTVIEHNANLCICNVLHDTDIPEDFYNNINPTCTSYVVNEEFIEKILQYSYKHWIVCGKLIRKDLVLNKTFSVGRIYEDNEVVCHWLCSANKVVDIDEMLYFYRINPISTTNSTLTKKHLDVLWALEEIVNFYKALKYKKVVCHICSLYIRECIFKFYVASKNINSKMLLPQIRKSMRSFYLRNHKYITIPDNHIEYAFGIMFPVTTKLVVTIKSFFTIK